MRMHLARPPTEAYKVCGRTHFISIRKADLETTPLTYRKSYISLETTVLQADVFTLSGF